MGFKYQHQVSTLSVDHHHPTFFMTFQGGFGIRAESGWSSSWSIPNWKCLKRTRRLRHGGKIASPLLSSPCLTPVCPWAWAPAISAVLLLYCSVMVFRKWGLVWRPTNSAENVWGGPGLVVSRIITRNHGDARDCDDLVLFAFHHQGRWRGQHF